MFSGGEKNLCFPALFFIGYLSGGTLSEKLLVVRYSWPVTHDSYLMKRISHCHEDTEVQRGRGKQGISGLVNYTNFS